MVKAMKDKLGKRLKELIDKEEWKELEDLLLNTEDEWVIEVSKWRIKKNKVFIYKCK